MTCEARNHYHLIMLDMIYKWFENPSLHSKSYGRDKKSTRTHTVNMYSRKKTGITDRYHKKSILQ